MVTDGKAILKLLQDGSPSAVEISMAKFMRNRLLLANRAKWDWYDRTLYAIVAAGIGFVTWMIIAMVGAKYWGVDWWATKATTCATLALAILLIVAYYALFYVSQVSSYRRINKEIDDLTQQLDEAIEAACGGPVDDDGNDADQIQEILDSYLR